MLMMRIGRMMSLASFGGATAGAGAGRCAEGMVASIEAGSGPGVGGAGVAGAIAGADGGLAEATSTDGAGAAFAGTASSGIFTVLRDLRRVVPSGELLGGGASA